MLPFLADLLSSVPAEEWFQRLTHTAFDELMVINLTANSYESRYHADGKFFAPVLNGDYAMLREYASTHLVHPEDREMHLNLMDPETMASRMEAAEPRGVLSACIRFLAMDGSWRQMEHLLISDSCRGGSPDLVRFYLYDSQDILEREEGQHQNTEELSERIRDLMPGLLPEKTFFAMAQERMHHLDSQWCMIAVDIKHFKLFQELNGTDKGEELLIRFAEDIHTVAEMTGGLACYRGQDDYGLLMPFDQKMIDRLFSTLCQEINTLSGTSGFCPIFGICMVYDADLSALDQFNRAALTAEEIKDDLQYHIRIYDPDTHERHVEEFKLLAEFKEAIECGEIVFHLQPQVNVDTGRIVGAESLARWKKADGSYVSPTLFVPVLEKYGVVTDLDTFLWEETCAWMRGMIDKGITPVPVSLNVSRINIFTVDVPEFLSRLAEKYGLSTSLIEVEITESAYVEDEERIQNTVTELRRRGFRVLMDDFGSGYSSLNMLRNISVDIIKLDAQFLRFSLGEEQRGINILESIINMTKSLSTPIIVEGVETPALVRYLKDLGCRYMQGFYYYRPMSPDQFEALISLPGSVDPKGIVAQRNEQLHIREFLDDDIYSDAMLNNILGPVAFYSLNDTQKNVDIIRFNSQFLHLIGLDTDVMEERRNHIQDYIHPEDREKFFGILHAARGDKINGGEGLIRVFKPNQSLFWMQLRVYHLRREKETDIFYASARDMTEIQYLNSDLPGGYYRCAATDDFEFLYVSRGFLDMFGYTREDLRRRFDDKYARMIHPDDLPGVRQASRDARKNGTVSYIPYRVLHRDGRYLYVVDQSHLTDLFGDLSWQAILINVTEMMNLFQRTVSGNAHAL